MPGCAGAVIVICALPVALGSAWLIAASVTLLGCGCVCGARYSTVLSVPEAGTHGFDADAQTCPTAAFPLGMPFTVQATPELVVPVTVAVKLAVLPAIKVADGGDTVTATEVLVVTMTVAAALWVPAVASITTELGEGMVVGAA